MASAPLSMALITSGGMAFATAFTACCSIKEVYIRSVQPATNRLMRITAPSQPAMRTNSDSSPWCQPRQTMNSTLTSRMRSYTILALSFTASPPLGQIELLY